MSKIDQVHPIPSWYNLFLSNRDAHMLKLLRFISESPFTNLKKSWKICILVYKKVEKIKSVLQPSSKEEWGSEIRTF